MNIRVYREPEALHLPLPAYATTGAAGVDLYAAEAKTLEAGQRALVSTGIRIGLPTGYEAQIRPRSGLALKSGVTLLNSPGTIDSDYRGIVKLIMINLGHAPFEIAIGDRIGQMVFAKVETVTWTEQASPDGLGSTDRGSGGFGHTGW